MGEIEMPWIQIKEVLDSSEYGQETQKRMLRYVDSVKETLSQGMRVDSNVFLMGQGINDKVGMFGMTSQLYEEFGIERVFDTPIAEAGLMGIAVGAAMAGQHPIYFHNRPDFLMVAMDQIVNHASKYCFMSGGQYCIPLIIWAVTGQGWGSAAQHSQTLQGIFMHIPGLKIVMPTTPYDVKGLLATAMAEKNPVLFLDHRHIHGHQGFVPEELYRIPFGTGVIRMEGNDVTIVGISSMLPEALNAAELLRRKDISAEVIDLRTIKPYDKKMIVDSVKKTGRLVIADTGWSCCGVATEIATNIYKECFVYLKKPIEIVALPDVPTPAAYNLEEEFYNEANDIYEKAIGLVVN